MGKHALTFWTFEQWFLAKVDDPRWRAALGPRPSRFLRRHWLGRAILFNMRWLGKVGAIDLMIQRRALVRACWE